MLHYGFQVRIRATDKPTGFAKAEAIRIAFNEGIYMARLTVTANGPATYIIHYVNGGELLNQGKNVPNSKRSLYFQNCFVTIKRVS
jgi:hypothetical protein